MDGWERDASAFEEGVALGAEQERERCKRGLANFVRDKVKHYPISVFGDPPHGEHGATVDSCSAKTMRVMLPSLADEIEQWEG